MDNNINLTILNETAKAAKMGMDSITYISEKVGDKNMKTDLSTQYNGYENILKKVDTQFEKYGEIPDDSNMGTKMMTWTGIQFNTITDKSNSHIAEMMIQGNIMGVVECQKLLNHNPRAEEPVKQILHEFVTFQNNNIEKMKEFL